MTDPHNTARPLIDVAPRVRTPESQVGTSTTVGAKFVAQWLELQEDTTALNTEIAQYRDIPTSEFVDLDDVED